MKLTVEINANQLDVQMLESLSALALAMFGDKKVFLTIEDMEPGESAEHKDKPAPTI